ncbi:fumarylacetoacetate hydrolase family protein [Pseudonocardia nematodicida]|uniref:Fumarylacetoacetate hydrolase family protein n=1 Tax=Pseudonocardia nematodicida TaxID=1206997 RepID=A0ABV1K379_9PSEU
MTTSTTDAVRTAAEQLLDAARTGVPCAPVRTGLSDVSVATGYAVQSVITRAHLDAGRTTSGRKIGLTSPAVQAQLGVDQPDFGVLYADMACGQDTPIDIGRLLQPRIEAEIAFVLGTDLDTGDIGSGTARAAVAQVIPAFEIVDSRVAGWDITIVDTVADNASSGLYVLGDDRRELSGTDLRTVEMTLTGAGGEVLSSGNGAACLGDPISALVWLARTAREFGAPLRAGEVILSGALGPMVPVAPGDSFTATLTGLGEVRARFTGGAA